MGGTGTGLGLVFCVASVGCSRFFVTRGGLADYMNGSPNQERQFVVRGRSRESSASGR
jgi:hypothetical protein